MELAITAELREEGHLVGKNRVAPRRIEGVSRTDSRPAPDLVEPSRSAAPTDCGLQTSRSRLPGLDAVVEWSWSLSDLKTRLVTPANGTKSVNPTG